MDTMIAPLPAAERARIAAAYGVTKVPETVTLVRPGHSAFAVDSAVARNTWGWTPAKREKTAARRERVRVFACKGLGPKAIAAELMEKETTVRSDLLALGLAGMSGRHASSPEIDLRRQRVLALLRAGRTRKQIAAELGVTYNVIINDLRALSREAGPW